MPLIDDDKVTSFVDVAITDDNEESLIVIASRAAPLKQPESRKAQHDSDVVRESQVSVESQELLPQIQRLYRYNGGASLTNQTICSATDSENDSTDTSKESLRIMALEEELAKSKFELAEARSQADWYKLEHRRLFVEHDDLNAFCEQLQTENSSLKSGRKMPNVWLRHQARFPRIRRKLPTYETEHPKVAIPYQNAPSHRHEKLKCVVEKNNESQLPEPQSEPQLNDTKITVQDGQVQPKHEKMLVLQQQQKEVELGSILELDFSNEFDSEDAFHDICSCGDGNDDDDDSDNDNSDAMPDELDGMSILSTDDNSSLARLKLKLRKPSRQADVLPMRSIKKAPSPLGPTPSQLDLEVLLEDNSEETPSRRINDDISVLTEAPSMCVPENRKQLGAVKILDDESRTDTTVETDPLTVSAVPRRSSIFSNNRYEPRRRSSVSSPRRQSVVGELTDMNLHEGRCIANERCYTEMTVNVNHNWWTKLKEPMCAMEVPLERVKTIEQKVSTIKGNQRFLFGVQTMF